MTELHTRGSRLHKLPRWCWPDRSIGLRLAPIGCALCIVGDVPDKRTLDALDVALLDALRRHPRAGALELSRLTGVARATVSARLQRLEDTGVITGYGPDVDVAAAGFGVQAFVTLEIAQGAIEDVQRDLENIPGLLEAHATTGSGDVLCRVAASSHEALQQVLVDLNRSPAVVRSTSVVALSELVPFRTLPLLASEAAPGAGRSAMRP
jgi:DNA-binding Lrp family transcriptional regulator